MKSIIWTGLLTTLLLGSCVSVNTVPVSGKGNPKNYAVELTAAPGANTLKVHSSPMKCHNGKEGCAEFPKGSLGTITFQFMGDQKEKDCNTHPAANWVITKVELSATGNTSNDKGVFGGLQPQWLLDAFPGVSETGLWYEEKNDAASRSVVLIDLNNHEGEEIAYYQITASSCDKDNPKTINIDPMVRNGGK